MSGWGDEALGSGGLRGLFEDYEDVYIESWRPGVMSPALWRPLDQLCIPLKSDGQLKFTNHEEWKNIWEVKAEFERKKIHVLPNKLHVFFLMNQRHKAV